MGARVAIVDGVRTPFCKAGGALRDASADELGAITVRELLVRTGTDATRVDEVIFGNVCQPAEAPNLARVIALKAGLPTDTIAYSVQRNCASGMQAVTSAAMQIESGRSELIVAGGAESMSQIPLLFGKQMTGLFVRMFKSKTASQRLKALSTFRPSFLKPIVGLELGLTDPVCELNMGMTAEVLARELHVTRDQQDEFALESHRRASEARGAGRFDDEVVGVCAAPYRSALHRDDGPRDEQTIEALAKLRPFFDRRAGTVTVGNACPVTDGAVALLLASEDYVEREGIEPLGFLDGWEYAALEGDRMGLGPVYATAKLLDATGGRVDDFDLVELNEAFAAQVLANMRAFESTAFAREHLDRDEAVGAIDPATLNVNGGAIALGHPVGATGARLILTLLKQLRRAEKRRGLATLCVGGGQGAAIALEAA